MVWFYHSPEGENEYKKIGLPYPKTVEDVNYDLFLDKTKRSGDEVNKTQITKMIRVKSSFGSPDGETNEEYIIYDIRETRFDSLGNEVTFTRTNVGRYPIPVAMYRVKRDSQGYEERFTAGVSRIRTGYSIKCDKTNFTKLHKLCLDRSSEKTQYLAQIEGEQRKYPIRSAEDFIGKIFDDLTKPMTVEVKQPSQQPQEGKKSA